MRDGRCRPFWAVEALRWDIQGVAGSRASSKVVRHETHIELDARRRMMGKGAKVVMMMKCEDWTSRRVSVEVLEEHSLFTVGPAYLLRRLGFGLHTGGLVHKHSRATRLYLSLSILSID